MDKRIVKKNTLVWLSFYLRDAHPMDSVWRNKHMNGLTEFPKVSWDNCSKSLASFYSFIKWEHLQGTTKIDLLHLLDETLKNNKAALIADNLEVNGEHLIALLVDFINYVGGRMGVDYALYTRDI